MIIGPEKSFLKREESSEKTNGIDSSFHRLTDNTMDIIKQWNEQFYFSLNCISIHSEKQ